MQSNKTLLTSSVLIVDDDIEALEEMADALQDYGLIVYTASNESMALELALRHRPEFIIMDYFLHGFTGIEVIKVIHNSLPEIQVIMISGFEDLSRLITTTNSDVISVLKKPLSIDSIGRYI
ncbi:MAG: DNA-binding NtrC family response regulator, partial [Candidatus Azotimanducaceae bacterium]